MRTGLVVALTLLLDAVFFAINALVFFRGGSKAVLSQAVATATDLVGSVMILWGQRAGRLPPSAKHPFGRGKERFFWSYSAGLVTFSLAGALVFAEGLSQVLSPKAVGGLTDGLLSVGGTLAVTLASLAVVFAEIRQDRGSVAELLNSSYLGVKIIFLQDLVSVAGAGVALAGLAVVHFTGLDMADGLSATIVGGLLLVTGFVMGAEARELLVGRAVSAEEGRAILSVVERYPFVRQVLGIQSMVLGPEDQLVALRVNFMDEMNTDDVEMHIDQLRQFIRGEFPRVKHLIIEPVRAAGEEFQIDETLPPSVVDGKPGSAAPTTSGPDPGAPPPP